jgi:hypothetical protein
MLLHRARSRALVLAAFAVALAALAIHGCGQSPTGTGYGTLAVRVQFDQKFDASGATAAFGTQGDDLTPTDRTPLSDLIITFDRVEAWACAQDTAMGFGGDDDSMEVESAGRLFAAADDSMETGDEDDGDCTSYVVSDSTITLSVAGLDTTLTQLLGVSQLPAGDYSRIVLDVTDVKVVTQAADTVQAVLPSGRLKVNSPFTIAEDSVTDVVIVFDLYRSIVEAPPGSMNFILKPVLHSHQGWDQHD